MLWFRFAPDWRIVFPAALRRRGFLARAGSQPLDQPSVNVRYRDFRYCGAVHRAVRSLRFTGRIQFEHRAGSSGVYFTRSTRWLG